MIKKTAVLTFALLFLSFNVASPAIASEKSFPPGKEKQGDVHPYEKEFQDPLSTLPLWIPSCPRQGSMWCTPGHYQWNPYRVRSPYFFRDRQPDTITFDEKGYPKNGPTDGDIMEVCQYTDGGILRCALYYYEDVKRPYTLSPSNWPRWRRVTDI